MFLKSVQKFPVSLAPLPEVLAPELPPGDTVGSAEACPFCEFAGVPLGLLDLPAQPASSTHVPAITLMMKAAARCCAGMVLPLLSPEPDESNVTGAAPE